MKYHCTAKTDLDDLIGHDEANGFCYGPLSLAMKAGEELELEESGLLSAIILAKLPAFLQGVMQVETGESLQPQPSFRLILH